MARQRSKPSVKLKPEELGQEHVALHLKPGRRRCFGKNLFLQASLSGGRSWVYRYRRNGKQTLMGLGAVADVSLEEAREAAAGLGRQLRVDKVDPMAQRRAAQAERAAAEALRLAQTMTSPPLLWPRLPPITPAENYLFQ